MLFRSELIVYLAPSLLGPAARPLVNLPDITRLENRVQLRYTDVTQIESDLRLTAVPSAPRGHNPVAS